MSWCSIEPLDHRDLLFFGMLFFLLFGDSFRSHANIGDSSCARTDYPVLTDSNREN